MNNFWMLRFLFSDRVTFVSERMEKKVVWIFLIMSGNWDNYLNWCFLEDFRADFVGKAY